MGPKPAQLRIILHGGPGTGKSFLAKCIKELANESHFTIGCLAPTGIAASNLPDGRTIHNFCGIPVSHSGDRMLEKPTASTLSILKERAQADTIALLVIDEISNVGPRLFAHVHTRMQHIMENDDAFGDLAVIAMGDFFQLPPVRPSETLCAAALNQLNGKVSIHPDKITTGPRSTGIGLFVTFRKVDLTEQMRAAGDVKHAELLAHLRSTSDIPIPRRSLEILKTLSENDIQQDPEWTRATIVVTSNEERYRIIEQQSILLARQNGCPRILWNKPINGIVAHSLTVDDTNFIYTNYTQFTGVFVEGAPAYLQDNINPRKGLSNGTPVTLHSLVLDPNEDVARVMRHMMNPQLEDVRLQFNPLYVLVKVPNADSKDFIDSSLGLNEVIIPLAMNSESKGYTVSVPFRKPMILKAKKIHGFELGFAITFHKIQGQTCQKLVVDLNERPFQPQVSFATFYVAISRVRRSQDLRLLPLHHKGKNCDHLLSLKVPKELKKWLASYDTTSGLWNPSVGKLCGDTDPSISTKSTANSKKGYIQKKKGVHLQAVPNPKTQHLYPPTSTKRN
jgi:hypothetical protein